MGTPLEKATEKYIRELRIGGFVKPTAQKHQGMLSKFLRWLSDQYPGIERPSDLTREALTDYQMYLYKLISVRKARLTAGSQHRYMAAVLSFLSWTVRQEMILINPGATIQLPREGRSLPRNYLSVREMRKLLSTPDLSTHLGVRNRAALEVFYSTGIRVAELQNLKLDHLNLQEGLLSVVEGKGAKDRVVPVGKAALFYLCEYIEKSRPVLLLQKDHSFVFVSRYGERLSKEAICNIVADTAKEAGIKRRITPHLLRHTCATLLLKGRADIRHIQELLGHKSLSSTQIYTRVEISDLKKVHAKCHPREREPIGTR